jgi:hypothetical protein
MSCRSAGTPGFRRAPSPGASGADLLDRARRDGRAAFAAITPPGQSLARKARHGHHEFPRQTFAQALDDQDLADLARIIDRLSAAIPG